MCYEHYILKKDSEKIKKSLRKRALLLNLFLCAQGALPSTLGFDLEAEGGVHSPSLLLFLPRFPFLKTFVKALKLVTPVRSWWGILQCIESVLEWPVSSQSSAS